MRNFSPAQSHPQQRQIFVPNELDTCSHVYPYQCGKQAPKATLQRFILCDFFQNKIFNVDGLDCIDTVSISRLKVPYVDDSVLPSNSAQSQDGTSVSRQGLQLPMRVTTLKEDIVSYRVQQPVSYE